jgi:hypothetical protein
MPDSDKVESLGADPFEGMNEPRSSEPETGFSQLKKPHLASVGDDPFKTMDAAEHKDTPLSKPFFAEQTTEHLAYQEEPSDERRRFSDNLDHLVSRFPNLEIIFWILASAIAFIAFLFFVPTFFGTVATPTPVAARATLTPRPTLTPIVRGTPSAIAPAAAQSRVPVVIPPLPPNAKLFEFAADPRRTGWLLATEEEPHWGDRNLHAGVYKGQGYQSILAFEASTLAPGSQIIWADVELTGLNGGNLSSSGRWSLKLFPADWTANWTPGTKVDFRRVLTTEIGTALLSTDLAEGQPNHFVFGSMQLAQLQDALNTTGRIVFRIEGAVSGGDSLFTWDAGDRNLPSSPRPILRIIAIPGQFVLVTQTPTPENVLTAVAVLAQATADATRFGTPTPLPRKYATALPLVPIPPVPTPANVETATARAAFATAVALTTGTFTPTPSNWATYTPTPAIIAPTLGPTATPTIPLSRLDLIKTPFPTELGLYGKILFVSNRDANRDSPIWVITPNGEVIGRLTGSAYYQLAETYDLFSPDKLFQVDVGRDDQGRWQIMILDVAKGTLSPLITEEPRALGLGAYHPAWAPTGDRIAFVSERSGSPEIYVYNLKTKITTRLTSTPVDSQRGYPPYNKHPSWSPDANQIVFFSDRGTWPPRDQLWVINADGGGMRALGPSPYNDSNPIWIKR